MAALLATVEFVREQRDEFTVSSLLLNMNRRPEPEASKVRARVPGRGEPLRHLDRRECPRTWGSVRTDRVEWEGCRVFPVRELDTGNRFHVTKVGDLSVREPVRKEEPQGTTTALGIAWKNRCATNMYAPMSVGTSEVTQSIGSVLVEPLLKMIGSFQKIQYLAVFELE